MSLVLLLGPPKKLNLTGAEDVEEAAAFDCAGVDDAPGPNGDGASEDGDDCTVVPVGLPNENAGGAGDPDGLALTLAFADAAPPNLESNELLPAFWFWFWFWPWPEGTIEGLAEAG